jgi:hypothetical protein
MGSEYYQKLQQHLFSHVSENTRKWIEQALTEVNSSENIPDTISYYSGAANEILDQIPITDDVPRLLINDYALNTAKWSTTDLFRVVLVLFSMGQGGDTNAGLLKTIYRYSDEAERACITRALGLFQNAEKLKQIALETGRTNSAYLFSAIALDNPYPAIYYTEHEYNQLVMKSLFIGLPITKIYGLETRANSELSRMCEDYIDERLSANRDVPNDIWHALIHHASEHGEEFLMQYISDDSEKHRYNVVLALSKNKRLADSLRRVIELRKNTESVPEIQNILQTIKF